MLQLALRGIRNNPFRYAATSLAVILGIAFFVATGVLTTSFRDTINSAVTEVFEQIDVAVQSTEKLGDGPFAMTVSIPLEVGDQLAPVDGVADVQPYVFGWAQAVQDDGKVVPGSQSQIGMVWIDNPELNPYYIVDGVAPTAANEMMIDAHTFEEAGWALGDEVRVLPATEQQPKFTIVGTTGTDIAGASLEQTISVTLDGAATILPTVQPTQFLIETADGYTNEQVVANVQAAIDADGLELEAITGDDLAEQFSEVIDTVTGFINTALTIFAGVALFVGIFVIYNTFSIIIAQRTKEMALLRAIGASGRQVSRSVLIEAIIIGLLASAAGAIVGIAIAFGLLQLLASAIDGFDIGLSIPPSTLIMGTIIGMIITVGAAWFPARRGARIAPIEALRDSEIEEVRASNTRRFVGLGFVAGGLLASLAGVGLFGDLSAWWIAAGLPVMIIGIFLIAPLLVRPVTKVLAMPLVRRGNITGELSRENAARNPKRTATTSLTLMIGVALMVTAAVFAATLSDTVRGTLEDTIVATEVVTVNDNVLALGGGLSPETASNIRQVGGVSSVVEFRQSMGEISVADSTDDPNGTFLTATNTADLDAAVDIDVTEGDVAAMGLNDVAISNDLADDLGVSIGDELDMSLAVGSARLSIVALYEEADLAGEAIVDLSTIDAIYPGALDSQLFIAADQTDEINQQIEALLADNPTAELRSKSQYITDQANQVNNLVYLLYGLLGMAVIVALIGIVNTMALSIHERTRELGLLRAVGMTRRQLKRTVRYESALVALMGTTVGILLGLLFSWLAYEAGSGFLRSFQVPWGQIVVVLIVGIVAGVISGILPARRAAKLDVLDAISHE